MLLEEGRPSALNLYITCLQRKLRHRMETIMQLDWLLWLDKVLKQCICEALEERSEDG